MFSEGKPTRWADFHQMVVLVEIGVIIHTSTAQPHTTMQVTAKQIRQREHCVYTLWDGEVLVHVHRHQGAYGHVSAVLVVVRIDGPHEVRQFDGYRVTCRPTVEEMDAWIAEQLSDLSQGSMLAAGTECQVLGLR